VLFRIRVFWHVTPCRLVSVSRRFEEKYCLHLHGFRPSRRMKNDSSGCEDEGTTILLKRREAPVQRNSVTCNFNFVLLLVTCAEAMVPIAVKLLCVTIRYCGCAGQAVIGIWCVEVLLLLASLQWIRRKAAVQRSLANMANLCNFVWLYILYNFQLHCLLSRAGRAGILSGRLGC
jgi:hypothetical protein